MKLRKKSLLASAIVFVLLALTFQFVWNKPLENSYAANSSSVTITNGNFNTSPSSYYLDSSPTGWTLINSAIPTTSGAINTNSDGFNSYLTTYQLTSNPETYYKDSSDTKILMINAKSSSAPNGNYNQGYKSNSITLNPYCYYSFSVLAKAEVGAVGSIYIKGLEDTLKFENISNTTWKEYKFFISTGSVTQKITFELWLGNNIAQTSSKAMFFDNVTGLNLSQQKYVQDSTTDAFNQTYEIAKNYITPFLNSDFETGTTTDWTANSAFPMNTYHRVINTNDQNSMEDFTFLGSDNQLGNKALWLASKNVPTTSFGYNSSKIMLPAFAVYKISFNAKVGDDTTATAVLKEADTVKDILGEDEYTPSSTSLTINSNDTSNSVMNEYKTYSFYICGHAQYDTEIYVELWLGTEAEAKAGSVLFDNFTVEEVTNTEYTNATAGANVAKLELKAVTGSLDIANGTFNSGINTTLPLAYPITPANWTVENTNNQVCGIINTNDTKFDTFNDSIGDIANPGNPEGFIGTENEYNNVLMMWNKTNSYQSIITDSITVDKNDGSSDAFYKLSFAFKTLPSDSAYVNFNLQILDQDSNKIYELSNINSTSWKQFTLYVRNGFYTTSFKIKLSLGTNNEQANGYLFLDNIDLKKQISMTLDQWKTLDENQTTFTKTIDFNNALLNTNSIMTDNDDYELLGFTGKLNSEQPAGEPVATSGAINTKNNKFDVVCDSANNNDKMIYIQTIANADYTLTSNYKVNLLEKTQYQISMFVKTNLPTVSENYDKKFGLNVELSGTTGKLEYINTNGEWKEYTFVVNVTDAVESQFIFNAITQNQTAGLFFIDSIELKKLSSEDYANVVEEKTDNAQYVFVGSTDVENEAEEEAETDDTNKGEFNWLIIPSLITALALLIALVGFIMKRINFKKFQKKIKTEYDRKKTLYRDVIRKQAQEMRDKEVQEYNKQIKELEQNIEELEQSHKEELANQRKEKGKAIDKSVEKSFKAYASKRTNLENKKEKLVEKVKTANSADYLLELQKKINLDMAKNLKEQNSQLNEVKPEENTKKQD